MKICFVAHNVYSFFYHNSSSKKIGGAEFQQMLIGKALAERGLSVSYISKDVGQSRTVKKEKLTFYKIFSEKEGLPGLRFFYPRLFKLFRALAKANADVYYARGAGYMAGITALFCKVFSKKFVFASAHDTDFIPGEELIPFFRDRWLYRTGLHMADQVISQTEGQNQLLIKNYGIESIVIRNFYSTNPAFRRGSKYILWVATIKEWKRPLIFIELAIQFPDHEFVMIGGKTKGNETLYFEIEKCSDDIENFKFLGFQELSEVEKVFDKCKVFVNTSLHEGFPNTFLQAWARGIPVLSLIDPDNVITRYGLGEVAESEPDLRYKLIRLLDKKETYVENIGTYFKKEHSTELMDKYINVFRKIIDS